MHCARRNALLLPLAFGLSLEQTAATVGLSKSGAGKLRAQFQRIQMGVEQPKSKAGLRNHARMTLDEEAALLAPFIDKAKNAGIIIVPPLKTALERHLGRSVAPPTVYRLLGRHGWRKLAPDKQHPNADIAAREERKKNSPKKSTRRNRASKTWRHSGLCFSPKSVWPGARTRLDLAASPIHATAGVRDLCAPWQKQWSPESTRMPMPLFHPRMACWIR